ncbi:E4 SUMO-protein ligase PIAL2 isoform X2 [Morus notabilis]|uniref:E4 SUMO-protein ligase PIAL2 isoform X2 n=1 Tax=Morus notabilis TaxID=981085 RepID=UPI000CECF19D|nr:E4 SUMO-protein ligase PIAL2 isoform X2 [Morus notabilis]
MTQTTASAPGGLNSLAGNGTEQRLTPAIVNSFRVSGAMERLTTITGPGQLIDQREFYGLCVSLSRGIDYAVANKERPTTARDLPKLMKQICDRELDAPLLCATMVLLISMKNACKVGWFPEKEAEELLTLSNEMGRHFCVPIVADTVTSCSHSVVATVMARFYPCMKMGHVFTSLEIKPGYGVYTNDFHILKESTYSPEDKICLLVVQVDKTDTSACIISPQQANFLINGKGVDRRTNVSMDPGPLMPTNVTPLLKYGTNLLQAVGQFNGHYVIVVAFMSETPLSETQVLPDYVQPLVDGSDSDADLIEGPSRISLNCPISHTRIKTPVKGHLCKHLQCFDFSNFVSINTRRPSWRCPHCNQCVCYSDIRVDQNMAKVLQEVGDDVVDVIISADGSWKAVFENDAHVNQVQDTNTGGPKETSELQEATTTLSNALPSVVDLTGDDDEMDIGGAYEIEDIKPSLANLSAPPHLNNIIGVNQNVAAVEDAFRTGGHISSGLASTLRSDTQMFVGAPQPTPATFVQTPSISPALNREADVHVNTNPTAPELHNLSSPNNLQLQQMPSVNSISSNEYGRFPTIHRIVSRTPIAVQALPAQSQAPGAPRLRPGLTSSTPTPTPSSSPIASQAGLSPTVSGFSTVYCDTERQQHFSRSLVNPPQPTAVASSSLQQHLNQNRQDRSFASPVSNGYRSPSLLSGFQNAHLQQAFNSRAHPVVRPSSPLSQTPIQQGSAQAGTAQASSGAGVRQTRIGAAVQVGAAAQMGRQSHLPAVQSQTSRPGPSLLGNAARVLTGDQRGNIGGGVQADSRANGSAEQNWQPTGRMRGSLMGRNYSHLTDIMIQPTQQAESARPPLLPVSSPPPAVPSTLQVLLANSRNTRAPQPQGDTTR